MMAPERQQLIRRSGRRVEWLAALWALTDPSGNPSTANADLLADLRQMEGLSDHPAFRLVARLRANGSRDGLIKGVVRHAFGLPTTAPGSPPLPFSTLLADALADVDAGWGNQFDQVTEESRMALEEVYAPLVAGYDSCRDVSHLVGEEIPVEVAFLPSLFLPPPQDGRHGVRIALPEGEVACLAFGLPLASSPGAWGITRQWLRSGGWHYAVEAWLTRHWQSVAGRLSQRGDLAEAWCSAFRLSQPAGWLRSVRSHLACALMGALWRETGYPAESYLLLATGQRFTASTWFRDWLAEGLALPARNLAAYLDGLPEALHRDRAWEEQARVHPPLPDALNMTMMPLWRGRPNLVFPDGWTAEAIDQVARGWARLPMAVRRFQEWTREADAAAAPAIAFGDPAENPLVALVLDGCGLSLRQPDLDEPVLVALLRPEPAGRPWRVAVAAKRAEPLRRFNLDMLLRLGYSHALFDGGRLVDHTVGRNSPLVEWEALA